MTKWACGIAKEGLGVAKSECHIAKEGLGVAKSKFGIAKEGLGVAKSGCDIAKLLALLSYTRYRPRPGPGSNLSKASAWSIFT